jgi:DNA-3-methyladenine glycosylase I
MNPVNEIKRCSWARKPLDIQYHDLEWGVPVHDDQRWFEFLTLEGAQAGLSWSTILAKREAYRKAFSQFDPAKVARFDSKRTAALLLNAGIVRNRLKVLSTVENAKCFIKLQDQFGSFDGFVWSFAGPPKVNAWTDPAQVPAKTPESDRLSRELLRRGFKFVGSTICYALMQATGMVNDHLVDCFRYREIV